MIRSMHTLGFGLGPAEGSWAHGFNCGRGDERTRVIKKLRRIAAKMKRDGKTAEAGRIGRR